VVGAVLLGAAVVAPSAGAHAVVLPGASRPADFQQYTLTVPTERDVPTVEVDLKVPDGITFLLVQNVAGWKTKVIKRNDRIDEIRWTGNEIPVDFFATFKLIARNPVQEGALVWPVVQRYKNGEVVRWIGPAQSDQPAARTTISEKAVPVDTLDVVSGRTSTATATAPSTPATTTEPKAADDGGRDGLTLAIAIVAAVAAVFALGVALLPRRRTA
jgi:uncharacterized protein YcnI